MSAESSLVSDLRGMSIQSQQDNELTLQSLHKLYTQLFTKFTVLEDKFNEVVLENKLLKQKVEDLNSKFNFLADDMEDIDNKIYKNKKYIHKLEEDVDDIYSFFSKNGIEIPISMPNIPSKYEVEADTPQSTVKTQDIPGTTSKSSLFSSKSAFDTTPPSVSGDSQTLQPTPYKVSSGSVNMLNRLLKGAAPRSIREGCDRFSGRSAQIEQEKAERLRKINQNQTVEPTFTRSDFGQNTKHFIKTHHDKYSQHKSPSLILDYEGNVIDPKSVDTALQTATNKWTPKSLSSSTSNEKHRNSPKLKSTSQKPSFSDSTKEQPTLLSPMVLGTVEGSIHEGTTSPIIIVPETEIEGVEKFLTYARSALNKMTDRTLPNFIPKLTSHMYNFTYASSIDPFLDLIFEKAAKDGSFASTYAQLLDLLAKDNDEKNNRSYIYNIGPFSGKRYNTKMSLTNLILLKTQQVYQNLNTAISQFNTPVADTARTDKEELELQLQRKKHRNTSKFIGELYLRDILPSRIIPHVLDSKLSSSFALPEDIEVMISLLMLIGDKLSKSQEQTVTKSLDNFMHSLEKILQDKVFEKRILFLVEEIIEMWITRWGGKKKA